VSCNADLSVLGSLKWLQGEAEQTAEAKQVGEQKKAQTLVAFSFYGYFKN